MKHLNINFFLIIFLLGAAFYPGCSLFGGIAVNAKEVEITEKWHLLQEGETVPAGAHIKMDMTTGEKWVKKISPHEQNYDANKGAMDSMVVNADGSTSTIMSSSTAVMSLQMPEETDTYNKNDDEFMMMYRVLSNLPPEEMGEGVVLPPLPTSQEEKQVFEAQLRAIWEYRQHTLATLSEQDDDDIGSTTSSMQQLQLPKLLTRYIRKLHTFLSQRHAACYGPHDEQQLEEEVVDLTDVLFILSELEYHLTDIDAARDFHTLGGWPVLGFLLSSPSWFWEYGCLTNTQPYYNNNSSDNIIMNDDDNRRYQQEREQLQTAVAWALGNAVKNHIEFAMWPLEPIPINPMVLLNTKTNDTTSAQLLPQNDTAGHVTVISLLLDIIQQQSSEHQEEVPSSVLPKALYALGSILRGNPYAQEYFLEMGGCLVLGNYLQNALMVKNYKIVTRILSLSHDILMEVIPQQQHTTNDDGALPNISEIQGHQELLVRGFTGEQWCQSAYQMFQIQNLQQSSTTSAVETVLRIVELMITHCQNEFPREATHEIIQGLKSKWSSDSEVEDEEWRKELLGLAKSIESKLRSS